MGDYRHNPLYMEDINTHLLFTVYSWFTRPKTEQLHSLLFWQNIPIPGQFHPEEFNQGVSLCGHTWNVGTDPLCQWHYDYFIKLFMNSPNSFKFLINVRYVDKEYVKGSHWVHPDAMKLFQEWYGIKHVSAGQTKSLANIDTLVLNPQLTNHVNTGGLHYLIVSLWLVPLFPETHLWKEAELTSKN